MASNPTAPIHEEHLRQASNYAFDELEECILNVEAALINHSKHTAKSSDSAHINRLLDRFRFMKQYWLQFQSDYALNDSRDGTKVKTVIELARDAGYQKGIAERQEEQYNEGIAEGYGIGYVDAEETITKPIIRGAIGLTLGVAIAYFVKKKK